MLQVEFSDLERIGAHHGLKVMACTNADSLLEHRDKLQAWQANGYAADMAYMQRDSETFTTPRALMESTQTVIMFSLSYDRGPQPLFRSGFGRVARYAWGKDYHRVIKKKFKLFVRDLEAHIGSSFNYRAFSDAVPLLERALAKRAGLGFYGKNTMLIRPKIGSFFFIAELLLGLDVKAPKLKVLHESCGTCSRCKTNCPTSAIVEDYSVDARRCISYLSIEKVGVLNDEERKSLGEWIFGCDICQEVCPFNHAELKNQSTPDIEEFSAANGCGGLLDLNRVLRFRNSEDFHKQFAGTPMMRPGRQGLLRNAAYVAANTNAVQLMQTLEDVFREDSDAVIRASALASLSSFHKKNGELSSKKWLALIDKAVNDSDITVSQEAKNYY